jgi:hypothetical protein
MIVHNNLFEIKRFCWYYSSYEPYVPFRYHCSSFLGNSRGVCNCPGAYGSTRRDINRGTRLDACRVRPRKRIHSARAGTRQYGKNCP